MEKRDILFIYPFYTYPRKNPPLGLAYLAAYIERAGFSPHISDFNVNKIKDDDFNNLLLSKPWLMVGISFMTNQFSEASRLSRLIKNALPDTPLVVGGPHPSSIPERTLEELPDIDILIKGEGEETLRELAESLKGQESFEQIEGLCFKKEGATLNNKDRELIVNIDELPLPAWKFLEIEKYSVFNIGDGSDLPNFALLSSRGCPNLCIFCDSHTIFGRKFRARSAENIFDEIMYLNNVYGMLGFDFVDDLITVDKDRILKLCGLLNSTDIPFRWMANARVNTVDREMLEAMSEAGCYRVDYGVETGDPEVRRRIKKNISDKQIRSAHLAAHAAGLSTGSFTMVGNLGENKNSAKMTVELLNDLETDVMVSIACPYPGTELYNFAKEGGLLNTEDWSRYVTSPTYTDNFKPVMRTEELSEEEILESFYLIHSFFARKKFRQRFGRFFLTNPKFYSEWILRSDGFIRRLKMAIMTCKSRVKSIFT